MGQKSGDSRTVIIVAIITGVFGILAAVITGIFSLKAADRAAEVQRLILATNTALVQQVQSGNSTQVSLEQTVSAPTITALPPLIITTTQQPTERPTGTPRLPSFSDDFESGIKSDWNVMFGNIGMANGAFTVIAPFDGTSSYHQAILDGHTWQHMRIKVNLLPFSHGVYVCDFPCGLEAAAGIIVRYRPGEKSIGFFILAHSRVMALGTMDENSEWNLITSTLVNVDPSIHVGINKRQLMIDAVGNTYTVYMDSQKIASASVPGITEGQTGLWFYNSNSDQAPESYAPRYDSFEVQALP